MSELFLCVNLLTVFDVFCKKHVGVYRSLRKKYRTGGYARGHRDCGYPSETSTGSNNWQLAATADDGFECSF